MQLTQTEKLLSIQARTNKHQYETARPASGAKASDENRCTKEPFLQLQLIAKLLQLHLPLLYFPFYKY